MRGFQQFIQLPSFDSEFLTGAFEFDDQHRRGTGRVVALHRGLRGFDGQCVHDLEGTGEKPRINDRGDGVARGLQRLVSY